MGNTPSTATTQDKIFRLSKEGQYHELKAILDRLQRSSPDFAQNPSLFLDFQDTDGNTPLLAACIKGNYQVAELLIQRGANMQIQNNRSDGGSALHEAINRRHEHIVALLLRHRADPFVENIKCFTPMDFACAKGNVELVRRLECSSPWKGWLEVKVPAAMGLTQDWKRRWVVICYRFPSPFASPERRRIRVSLLCYKSTTDTIPDSRMWLDGAKAIEVSNSTALGRTNGRTPAQMELKLHRSHSAPSGCAVTGNSREGYCLHFRPDEGSYNGCQQLRTWAEIVNRRRSQLPQLGQQPPFAPPPLHGTIPNVHSPAQMSPLGSTPQSSVSSELPSGGVSMELPQQRAQQQSLYPQINYNAGAASIVPPPPPAPMSIHSSGSAPLAPLGGTSAVQPRPSPSSPQSNDDNGICCVCLDTRATHGFVHGRTVHQNICKECAEDYEKAGRSECPTCRQSAAIVRIFVD